MDRFYQLAIKHLFDIRADESKKHELKTFAQALMNREI